MAIHTSNPGLPLEAITRYDLEDRLLEAEAEVIAAVLEEMGVSELLFECDAGQARISVDQIVPALRTGLPEQDWDPWEGSYSPLDRTFVVPDRDLEFKFCHEDQVHVRTRDPELLQRFWERWLALGLAFGRRNGEEWDWETSQ